MKAILTLMFCLLLMGAKAQSSGDLLRKAGSQMKTGFALSITGPLIMGYSTTLMPETRTPMFVVGAITTAIGAGLTFSGYNNIQKAGRAMEREKRTGLLLTPSGFAYRF